MTERPPRTPKAPFVPESEKIAEFAREWNDSNKPADKLEPNEVSTKVPLSGGTPQRMSWKDKSNAGMGAQVGVTDPYEDLGEATHAKIYQNWAHQKGMTSDNWDALIARHGDEKAALKHSLWSGTVPQVRGTARRIMSPIDKLIWQKGTGLAITQAAREQRAQEIADYRSNPENQPKIKEAEGKRRSRREKAVQSIGLGGEDELTGDSTFKPGAQEALDRLSRGEVRTGKPVAEVPDMSDPRQRHALDTPNTLPSIKPSRHAQPAAAEYFGESGDFSHHESLGNHIKNMLAQSQGMSEENAKSALKAASPTMSFNRQVTPVHIPTRAEHHANKAMQYLAASAKAQSLGMPDIAVNNYAQAVEHVKHLETAANPSTPAGATNTLASLLAPRTAASTSSAASHLDRYKAALGVK